MLALKQMFYFNWQNVAKFLNITIEYVNIQPFSNTFLYERFGVLFLFSQFCFVSFFALFLFCQNRVVTIIPPKFPLLLLQ